MLPCCLEPQMLARSPFAGSPRVHPRRRHEVCAGSLPTLFHGLVQLPGTWPDRCRHRPALAASFPTRCTNDREGGLKAGAFKAGLSAVDMRTSVGSKPTFALISAILSDTGT